MTKHILMGNPSCVMLSVIFE